MSHVPKVMNAFSRLLSYPDQHTAQAAELLYIVLRGEIDEAADAISRFGAFLEQREIWRVEESFTGTFDVNPACALEVGWHLFGEEYARGMFLVRMREELRKHELTESVELPDHISHVLAVVAVMQEQEAAKFVTACVQPAVETMNEALQKTESPYRHVISGLTSVIRSKWGVGKSPSQDDVLDSRSPQVDPLHAFPIASVGCGGGCGDACGGPELISLDLAASCPPASNASEEGK